ncbi:MAG: hypothetical protein AB7K24_05250 [Gemmataceae bacterium]
MDPFQVRKAGFLSLGLGLAGLAIAFGVFFLSTLEANWILVPVGLVGLGGAVALRGVYMLVTGRYTRILSEAEYLELYKKQSWARRSVPLFLLLGGAGGGILTGFLQGKADATYLAHGAIIGLLLAAFVELHAVSDPAPPAND